MTIIPEFQPETVDQQLLAKHEAAMNAMYEEFLRPLGVTNPTLRSWNSDYLIDSPYIGFMSGDLGKDLAVLGIFTMPGEGGRNDVTTVGDNGGNLICAEIDLLNFLGKENVIVFSDLRNMGMGSGNAGLVRHTMRLRELPINTQQVVLVQPFRGSALAQSLLAMVPGLNAGISRDIDSAVIALEVAKRTLISES